MQFGLVSVLATAGGVIKQWTPAQSMRLAMLIGLFIVAVLALGIVLVVIRRKMMPSENELAGARSLMDELRAMRDSGEMSEQEYEAARRSLASKVATRVKKEAAQQPRESFAAKIPRSEMPPPAPKPAATRTARPGYDLTGAPLPKADDGTDGGAKKTERQ